MSVWSLGQRNPTESSVSECDREPLIMRRPWPTTGCRAITKELFSVCKIINILCSIFLTCTVYRYVFTVTDVG